MSMCSLTVLTVNGRVGLVEAGSTFRRLTMVIMSGAWPPPAPSTWKTWIGWSPMALMVSATAPASFSESACRASWAPVSLHTSRHLRSTAGVAPQSS